MSNVTANLVLSNLLCRTGAVSLHKIVAEKGCKDAHDSRYVAHILERRSLASSSSTRFLIVLLDQR